jgi:peptidoglycan hydrolase-like protein with peptidoglycan-binding domain
MKTISRESFVENFKTAGVQVDGASREAAISPSVANKLRQADLNGDGKISGSREANHLFDGLDNYDPNGNDHSFVTERAGTDTALGKVVKALFKHPATSQAPNNNQRISIPLQAVSKGLKTIRYGEQGVNVRALQEALLKTGANIAVDGDFGPGTLRAVKDFQRKEGLTPDGVVGPQVADKLLAKLGVAPQGESRAPVVAGSEVIAGSSQAGSNLASRVRSIAMSRNTTGKCYSAVADAVDAEVGRFLYGNSAYMAADQFAAHPGFKEMNVSASKLRELPAGAVVVWGKTGVSPHGHISIALGDGREASDHIDVQRTQLRGHTNVRVFIPS